MMSMSDYDYRILYKEADRLLKQKDAELADVRHQRETLKDECAALTEELKKWGALTEKATDQNIDAVRTVNDLRAQVDAAEHYRVQALDACVQMEKERNAARAEVERRGDMLKRALPHLWVSLHGPKPETDERRNRAYRVIDEIESLDPAPDQSQRGTDNG